MKLAKLFFTALVILFAQQVYAQSSPYFTGGYIDAYGSKTVDKGANTSQNSNNKSLSQYSTSVFLGRRLNEHWRAGVNLQYSYRKQFAYWSQITYGTDTIIAVTQVTTRTQTAGLGIFAYYLINPDNQLVFYLYPTIKYAKNKQETTKTNSIVLPLYEPSTQKGSTLTGALRLGALYRFSPRWELFANVASIYFSHSSTREILQSGEKSEPIITNQLSGTFFPANIQLGVLFHF